MRRRTFLQAGALAALGPAATEQKLAEKIDAELVRELGEDPDETELCCRADYARCYDRPKRDKKKKSSPKKQTV